jgi:hypothetical protein
MMKKTISLFMTGLLLVGTLSACAETDKASALSVSKDTQQMIATAALPTGNEAGQTLRQTLGAPERVEENLTTQMEKYSITIAADVSVPEVDHLSVYRVNAAEFSEAFIAKAFDYFCKDETMYDYNNLFKTKDQIQGQIDSMQRDLDRNYSPNGSGDTDDSWRTEYEAEIAKLKAELPTAKEDLGDPIASAGFAQDEAAGGGTYEVFTAVNAPKYPYTIELFAWNNVKYQTNEVRYIESTNTTVAPHSEATFNFINFSRVSAALFKQRDVTNEAQIAELKTTPQQAKEQVTSLLQALDISNMAPYRVCLAQEYTEDGTGGEYAYYVQARRVVDGVEVQSPYNRTYVGGLDGGKEWAYETLSVRLDDEGIIGMNWTSPLTVGAVEVERANLLPFSSILTVAKNMLPVANEPQESDLKDLKSYNIEIDQITLSLQRIPDANSIDSGMLIPVWNFYGQQHYILPYDIEVKSNDPETSVDALEEPYLSINAIDGSVISKTLGY